MKFRFFHRQKPFNHLMIEAPSDFIEGEKNKCPKLRFYVVEDEELQRYRYKYNSNS